jgi:hypothetical protein
MREDAPFGLPSQPASTPLPPALTRRAGTGAWEAGPPLPPFLVGDGAGSAEADLAVSADALPGHPPDAYPEEAPAGSHEEPPAGGLDEEGEEAFPLDAFFIPEEADHIAAAESGESWAAAAEPTTGDDAAYRTGGGDRLPPEVELADRLERLARRLRTEGAGALLDPTGREDRLDTLLGGVLAGYLAAHHD